MKIEILTALIALGSSLFGAFIGAGVSVWITNQQLSASFKQNNIEVIQGQITKLGIGLDQLSKNSIDVKDPNITPDQIISRMTDKFLQQAAIFLTFSYQFSKIYEVEAVSLSAQLNHFIYLAKTRQSIDEVEARKVVEQIPVLQQKWVVLFRERLRLLQSKLDKLTVTLE